LLSDAGLWVGIAGSLVLWVSSGTLAVLIGVVLAAGSLSPHRPVRVLARVGVNLTRGIPTSLFVIGAGIGTMHQDRGAAERRDAGGDQPGCRAAGEAQGFGISGSWLRAHIISAITS